MIADKVYLVSLNHIQIFFDFLSFSGNAIQFPTQINSDNNNYNLEPKKNTIIPQGVEKKHLSDIESQTKKTHTKHTREDVKFLFLYSL